MGFDAYCKIAGLDGESRDKSHEKWIDILSFHWGVTQTGTSSSGMGSGGGKANVQDFSIVKKIDRATPELFMHCCSGEHFDKVEVVIRKAGGTNPVEYLKYKFSQVLVSSVRPGGSAQGADDVPLEEISFNFAKCEFDYTPQNAQGKPEAAVHAGWDLAVNQKA